MMAASDHGLANDTAKSLDWPADWGVLGERRVRSDPDAIASEPNLADQTRERIKNWILHRSIVGQVAVVLLSHRGLNEYRLDEIVGKRQSTGSLRLNQHGDFDRLGRGSSVPRATFLQLLIPTPEVLQAALGGCAWLNGKPAFTRPLSEFECQLADRVNPINPEDRNLPVISA